MKWALHILTSFCLLSMALCFQLHSADYTVYINASQLETFSHFWKSTGFCPPQPHQDDASWMLSQDMTHNLAYIGALPMAGIEQVRIHWLLDLVKISNFQTDGKPVYNFTNLDQLLGNLWQTGLKPGFEIMGNPSGYFTDLENKTQAYLWKELVQQIAYRYIEQFGAEYVLTWNFETWNEPENGDFDTIKFTAQGFMNYYDACYEGLKTVNANLRLGTPGGNCLLDRTSGLDYTVLDHVANGRSMFSGRPLSVDYISCHRKGDEPDNSAAILKKEQQVFDAIHSTFPALAKVPLANDEGDPLVGWSRGKWWRADSTYAAMVAKIIAQHQYITKKNYNYQLLSNDNGFLSYNPFFFTQRTLLARFQINNTNPHYVQYVRKPVHSVMGLLSFLGEKVAKGVILDQEGHVFGPMADFGAIATIHEPQKEEMEDGWELIILLYNSKDSHNVTTTNTIEIKLEPIPASFGGDIVGARYQLDNVNGNPYAVWKKGGSPSTPGYKLFQDMRMAEGPKRVVGPGSYKELKVSLLSFQLPLPGVSLIHLCLSTKKPPGQVTSVTFYTITHNQVLVTWSDSCIHARCIKTYEVEYSSTSETGTFVRINQQDSFFTSYVNAPKSPDVTVVGYYRIRVVDYWNRSGAYSLVSYYKG